MDIERIVVRLVADTTAYVDGLNRAEARMLYFAGFLTEQVGRAAISLAADFERLQIAFEVMTGSAEEGLKVLNEITKLAIESPFTSAELISAGKQVKAFGFDTQDLIPILSRLGDVSVATGTDINRIILAFGQVRTTGRLMGQELRQFTNAGIPILEYLAKVTGQASSAIPQLVRQGRIGFADVAQAFNLMTSEGGLFFGMMERTNLETVWGRWQNVVESLQVGMRNFGLEAFALFRVKETLTSITNLLKDMNSEEGLAGIRERLREIKAYMDFALVPLETAWKTTVEWYHANKEVADTVLITLAAVKAVTIAAWLLEMPFKALLVTLRLVYTTLLAVRAVILGTALIAAVAMIKAYVVAIVTVVVSIVVILLKVVVVVTLIVAALAAAVVAFKVIAFFAGEVWKTIQAIGQTDFWKILEALGGGVGATLSQWGQGIWAAVKKAFGPVGDLIGEFFAFVADGWKKVWQEDILPVIEPYLKQVRDEFTALWGWFTESAAAAWKYVLGFFDRGVEQAKKFAQLVQEVFGSVKDAILGGDAVLAWDIIFATLKVGWERLIGWLKIEWKAFSDSMDNWLNESMDKFAIRSTYAAKIAVENTVAGGLRVPQMEAERDRLLRGVEARYGANRAGIQDERTQMLRMLEENLARGGSLAALRELQSLSAVLREVGPRVAELAKLYAQIPTHRTIQGDVVPDMARFEPPALDLSALSATVGAAAAEGQYRALAFNAMQAARTFQNYLHEQATRPEGVDPALLGAARTRALDTAKALDEFVQAMTRTGRAARELVSIPSEVSAAARAWAAETTRAMERGMNPMEDFMRDWVKATEALTGPLQTPERQTAFAAALGPAGAPGLPKWNQGIIDQETHDFGLYRSYEAMRKWLPDMSTNRPTAALQGSREAYEIMARANMQGTDTAERLRAEIAMGNSIATMQYQEQQRTTAALESLRKEGVVVPARAGQRGR